MTAPSCSHLIARILMRDLFYNWRKTRVKKKKIKTPEESSALGCSAVDSLLPQLGSAQLGPRRLPAFFLFTRQRRDLMTPRGCRYDRSDPLHSSPAVRKKQKRPRPSWLSGTEAATKALSTQSVFVSRIDSSAARGVFTRANSRLLYRKASVKRL